jgi:hypothetical protein
MRLPLFIHKTAKRRVDETTDALESQYATEQQHSKAPAAQAKT